MAVAGQTSRAPSDLRRPRGIDIGQRHEFGPGDAVSQMRGEHLPHATRADQTNADCHPVSCVGQTILLINLGYFDRSALQVTLLRSQADNQRHTAIVAANGYWPVGNHGLHKGLDLRRIRVRIALHKEV